MQVGEYSVAGHNFEFALEKSGRESERVRKGERERRLRGGRQRGGERERKREIRRVKCAQIEC